MPTFQSTRAAWQTCTSIFQSHESALQTSITSFHRNMAALHSRNAPPKAGLRLCQTRHRPGPPPRPFTHTRRSTPTAQLATGRLRAPLSKPPHLPKLPRSASPANHPVYPGDRTDGLVAVDGVGFMRIKDKPSLSFARTTSEPIAAPAGRGSLLPGPPNRPKTEPVSRTFQLTFGQVWLNQYFSAG